MNSGWDWRDSQLLMSLSESRPDLDIDEVGAIYLSEMDVRPRSQKKLAELRVKTGLFENTVGEFIMRSCLN